MSRDFKTSESPRVNFDNPLSGSLAIFQFVLNEEWHVSMYDYIRNSNDWAILFWLIVIMTGEVLMMKLFVALFINKYL